MGKLGLRADCVKKKMKKMQGECESCLQIFEPLEYRKGIMFSLYFSKRKK